MNTATANRSPISLLPSKRPPRVYLAGPDVFKKDNAQIFAALSRLAHEFGLSSIVPMEGWGCVEVGPQANGQALAQRIFAANIARLDSADGVIANLCDFRGTEPDAGTVFEVGYAHARGIPIVGREATPRAWVIGRRVRATAQACYASWPPAAKSRTTGSSLT